MCGWQQLAAHAADDARVANAHHCAAMGVREGTGIDLERALLRRRSVVGAVAICAGGLGEVGEEEGVWGEFGKGLWREGC